MNKYLLIAVLSACFGTFAHAVIIGFEAGYLTDSKDAYFATRLGYEFKADTSLSHQVEAEIGYSESTESNVNFKILPLTLNYRAEFLNSGKLSYYLGGGIGVCRSSISFPGSGVRTISDHDSSFVWQGFAGVNYKAAPTIALHLGLKYLWIGDAELVGIKDKVGDDLAIIAGLSFKF